MTSSSAKFRASEGFFARNAADHSLVHPAKNLQRTNAVAIPGEHQQFAEIIGSGSSEIKDQPVSDDLNVNVGIII
jgi:hypothetical protein